MADAAPRLYKMMGSVMGVGVIVVAMFADYWPWSLLGFALVALAIVGVYFTNWVQANYIADRKRYFDIIHRADSQHAAILAGGDKLAWGFYGNFLPKDDWNVFSDRWEESLKPEPKPLPPPPTAPLRESSQHHQGCGCETCHRARVRQLRRDRDRPGRLRQPVAEVHEFGQRDPVQTFYCDNCDDDRDWWDEA